MIKKAIATVAFCLVSASITISSSTHGKEILYRSSSGEEVSVQDIENYFSPYAPGLSPERMRKVPNIELAIESLYVSRRLARDAVDKEAIEPDTAEWLGIFLRNRELMQGEIKRAVEERLVEVDWAGLAMDYYLGHPEEFKSPEQIRASHILFKLDDRRLYDVIQEAEAVRVRLLGGENFASVADEVSGDEGGLPGGDLGFFSRGRMVPAFESAAFSTEVGSISDLVVTSYGVHLIAVTDTKASETIEFSEVQAAIEKKLKPQIARETREQLIEQLRAEMLANDNFINRELIEQLRARAHGER